MHVIRPAEKGELRSAIGVLLSRPETSRDELDCQIDTLLRYAAKQRLSLEQCLVAFESGRIVAACLSVDAPGRTSSVFIPNYAPTPALAGLVVELLKETVIRAQARRIRLLQGLVAPEAVGERDLFDRAGFRRLTQLIYMEREATALLPRGLPWTPLAWEEFNAGIHREFARVVEGTYEGSMDCPGLSGVRDIEDTLASHRAAGEFDPRHWLLARENGVPVGVLLMARIAERGSLEVVYMGLLPEARGRGLGVTLLRRAIETARAAGVGAVTLTVDVENAPARTLYAGFEFREWSRREVWMKILERA